MIIKILLSLSIGILGVFLGAQIMEGVLFVPYWKTLPAKDFFELHQTFGKKIYQFFAPLTIIATILPLITLAYSSFIPTKGRFFIALMGICTVLFFSTYFLFFKEANQQFAEASIAYEALPQALETWGNWHWGRIVFEFWAFVFAIIALINNR